MLEIEEGENQLETEDDMWIFVTKIILIDLSNNRIKKKRESLLILLLFFTFVYF